MCSVKGCFGLTLALAACSFLAGCPPDPVPQEFPPTARFSAMPTSGAPGVSVQFTDESDPGSAPVHEWYWNFGDGATSGEQHPAHVYEAEGVYTVGLRVSSAVDADMVIHEAFIRVTRAPDTSPPVISLNGPAEVVLECGAAAWEDPGATAVDDRDPMVQVLVGGDAVLPELGVYTITYDGLDDAGNRAAQMTRTVRVADTTAPVISLNGGDGVLECGEGWEDPGATAVDVCDGAVEVVVSNAIDPTQVGVQTLVYTATDTSGNASQVTRVVRVLDATPPVISLVGGDVALECGEGYEDPGATALDECEGAVEVVSNAINTWQAGVQTLVYTATDGSGNSSQVTRTVGVVDTLAPLLLLVGGDVVLECGEAFSEPGATAVDGCDGELAVEVSGEIGAAVGEYPLTYRAVDGAGNAALPMARRVTVVDSQPPQITMTGGDMSIYRGVPFRDPGARAWDACDGNVAVVAGGEAVDTDRTGAFTLTYDAADAAGNVAAQKQRRVTVIEPCPDAGPWATVFGRNDRNGNVAQLSDCSLLCVTYPKYSPLRFRKLSTEGEVIWTREFEIGHAIGDVAASARGGAFLYGRNAITRISNSGIVQWRCEVPSFGIISKLLEAPDGRIWIMDYGINVPGIYRPALIALLDSNGAVVWSREHVGLTANDIAVAPDGDLVMAGMEFGWNSPPVLSGAVSRIDARGEVRWDRRYPRENLDRPWGFTDIASTEEGFVVTGPGSAGSGYSCTALDEAGEVRWERGTELWKPEVAVTLDQEILLVGRAEVSLLEDPHGNVEVTKLDVHGDTLWEQVFRQDEDRWVIDSTPTFAGGIAVVTQATDFADAGDPVMALVITPDGMLPETAGYCETPGWMSRYTLPESTEMGDFIATEHGFALLARGEDSAWIVQTDGESKPLQHALVSRNGTESMFLAEHPLGFVLADTINSGENDGSHLRCVSPQGETLWDSQVRGPSSESTGLVRANDGSEYVLIGNVSGKAYAVCVSGAGEVVWEHEFGYPAFSRIYAAASLSNGDWAVAGRFSDEFFVARITRSGILWWQRSYDSTGSVRCITEVPGGDLVFVGADESYRPAKLEAIRVTPEGEVLWRRLIGTLTTESGSNIVALSTGDTFLAVLNQVWWMNPEGEVLRKLSFGQSLNKIVPAGEGNFVFGKSSEGRPALVKFTPTGETAVVYEDFVLE